jgi:hypothetical protein
LTVVGRPSNARSRPPPRAGLWRLRHGRCCPRMEGASIRLIFKLPEPAKAKKVNLNANCLALSNSTPILQRRVVVRFFSWSFWRRPPSRDTASRRAVGNCRKLGVVRKSLRSGRRLVTSPRSRVIELTVSDGSQVAVVRDVIPPAAPRSSTTTNCALSRVRRRMTDQRYLTLHHGNRIEDPQRELKRPARPARSSRVTSCVRRLRSCQAPVRTQTLEPWPRSCHGSASRADSCRDATNALHRCYSRATHGFPCQTKSKQCRRFRPTGPPGSQPWTLRATTSN